MIICIVCSFVVVMIGLFLAFKAPSVAYMETLYTRINTDIPKILESDRKKVEKEL